MIIKVVYIFTEVNLIPKFNNTAGGIIDVINYTVWNRYTTHKTDLNNDVTNCVV